jgi:hypothetical protein
MVQFTLPKNSKGPHRQDLAAPEGAKNVRKFQIYRWNPDDGRTRASTPISSIWTSAARWFWTR